VARANTNAAQGAVEFVLREEIGLVGRDDATLSSLGADPGLGAQYEFEYRRNQSKLTP
jgi:hypothetical protein